MGVKVSFGNIPEQSDFTLIPLGKYPCRLTVEAYQKDQQGNPMTDGNNEPVMFHTNNGDTKWNLSWEILDGPQKGRKMLDNLNFSQSGLKRVRVVFVRAGFPEEDFAYGSSKELDLEPDDIDQSCWWCDIEHQPPFVGAKESKFVFKRGACNCTTCVQYDGQKVFVNAKPSFAGMELMKPAEALKYRNGAAAGAGACGACNAGAHTHVLGDDKCACEDLSHLPF